MVNNQWSTNDQYPNGQTLLPDVSAVDDDWNLDHSMIIER